MIDDDIMTIEETIQWFNTQFEQERFWYERPANFYCGITNDLGARKQQHNVDDLIAYVKCDSFDTARQIENLLHETGYDTGKQLGHGQGDSIFVYMYRKIKGQTIE